MCLLPTVTVDAAKADPAVVAALTSELPKVFVAAVVRSGERERAWGTG